MQQPPGYMHSGKEEFVCKLRTSIYGLKQSPRCLNAKLSDHLKSLGFKEGEADPCVFIKSCKLQIIAVYVDDLILMAETVQEMEEMKEGLASTFRIKDMGELCFCLGINFEQNDEGISLCQKQYLMKLLAKYGSNTWSTPMDSNVKLQKDDGYSKKVDAVQYQLMVGNLMHAARATRPDIAFAVSTVSKCNAAPTQAHLTAAK